MDIKTSRFGNLQVQDSDIITVLDGVLGFPDHERFVILEHDADAESPFKWLQAVDNPDLAFVVIDPRLIDTEYAFEVDEETAQRLKCAAAEDIIPMVIVKFAGDDPAGVTANLRGPIVVHSNTRIGCQIVLTNEAYAFNYPVFAAAAAAAAGEPATNDAEL